jgi:hypothetical protein
MGKTLIIAEKPSVAGDIAKALGGFKKQSDYYENDSSRPPSAIYSPLFRRNASKPRGANGRSNICPSSRRILICCRLKKPSHG